MNKLKDYFHYTRRERNATIILISLILLVLLVPMIYKYFDKQSKFDYTAYEKEIEAFEASKKRGEEVSLNDTTIINETPLFPSEAPTATTNTFPFDPNTATFEEFQKLGLSPKVAHTIINFREKGGKFYKKEDLKKIYGLSETDYQRLEPYIRLSNKKSEYKDYPKKDSYKPSSITVAVNDATAEEFQKLYGIGPAFASRIIKFREALGGFSSIEQIGDTYGLPDSTFQSIKPQLILGDTPLKKININTATFEDLKAHPYFTYKTANALIKYRKTHGNFSTIEDLKKLYALKAETIEKLAPYLEY